jgi:clan AA aspartic protease (TIGR02281 family)
MRMALRPNLVTALLVIAWIAMESGPALAAPGKCTLSRIAEWPVRPGTGYAVVDGTINGQKIGVMLDTGAGKTMLSRPEAERLGLVRRDLQGARVVAIGGETHAEMVVIDEFAIGPVVRKNLGLMVAGEQPLREDVAVVLGEDFFRQLDIEFDLPHDMIRLFQARDCEGTSLAYWAPGGAAEVDLEIDSTAAPQIELRIEVNGRRFLAQLDSGAYRSVLAQSAAESVGVTPTSPGVVTAGCFRGGGEKVIETWIGRFESFRVGSENIRDPKLYFADMWRYSTYTETGSRVRRGGAHADMLLGADFLRAHRVLVAHSQRKMYFDYVNGTVFPTTPAPACDKASK